jgi:uncharacterized OB-fold protein
MRESDWEDDADDEEDVLDGDGDTTPCPNCGREIYDDAEQCPHCGYYVTDEEKHASAKPWWVIAGVLLCLAIAAFWLFH